GAHTEIPDALLPHGVRGVVTRCVPDHLVELCRISERHVQRDGDEPRDDTTAKDQWGNVHAHDVADAEQRGPQLTAETEYDAPGFRRAGRGRRGQAQSGLEELQDRTGDRRDHDVTRTPALAAFRTLLWACGLVRVLARAGLEHLGGGHTLREP